MSTGFDEASIDQSGSGLSNKYGGIGGDDERTSSSAGRGLVFDVPSLNATEYSRSNRPRVVNVGRMPDPYFYNGPRYAPWQRGQTELAQQTALASLYRTPEKLESVQRFGSLFRTYGSTNSPGVLWALAQQGDAWDDQTVAGLLDLDARAVQRAGSQSGGVKPGSPNGQAQDAEEQDGNSLWENMWAGPQFVARNAFSLLSAPMEAIQGGVRTAGGALAQETGPDALKATLGIASIIPGLGVIANAIYGDENFEDAWEQTDAGQQVLAAFTEGLGFDAFTSGTAGIDYDAVWNEIANNPEYSGYAALLTQDPGRASEILTKVGQEKGLYSNPGWFIEENSQVGEAQRQATFQSWAIPYGKNNDLTSWTLGRGITSAALPPGHTASMGLSGLIDAAAAIFGDPTIIGSKFGAGAKLARAGGILIDAKGAPLKALETARNDVRELGKAEMALTYGKEKKRVTQALTTRNTTAALAREEWNRTHPDEAPLTAAAWEKMTPEEQLFYTRDSMMAQATTDATKGAKPDLGRVRDTAREVRRAEAQMYRAERAAATAPYADDVEAIPAQAQLWEEMAKAARVSKPRPEGGAAKPREWTPVEQPKAEPLTWTTPEQAPAAPRELTIDGSGSNWNVKWGEDIIGTSTSKNGAAAMRRRILKKDAEDGQMDSALAAGRGVLEANGYRIAPVPGKDRVTLTTPDGQTRTFKTVDQAKAAVEKETAGTVGRVEFTYGDDIRAYAAEDGTWRVETPEQTYKMKNQSIAQRWAEQKAAEADQGQMTVYSAQKFERWYGSLTPEQQSMWDSSVAYFNDLVERGQLEGLDWTSRNALDDAIGAFVGYLNKQGESLRAAPAPKGKYADQVDKEAALMILEDRAGTELLDGVDSAGLTMQQTPSAGFFQRAVMDGADVLTTWAGDVDPVFKSADDAIDQISGAAIYEFLAAVVERRPLRPAVSQSGETVSGQVAQSINDAVKMLPALEEMLKVPGTRYRDLFRVASAMGIEGYLDDALRQVGVDGLTEINAANRAGVWMGDHPLMETYLFPQSAVDNAAMAAAIPDDAEKLKFLETVPSTAVPYGYRASNLQDLAQARRAAAQRRKEAVKGYNSTVGAHLTKADTADAALNAKHAEIDSRFLDPEEAFRTILRQDAGISRNFMAGHTIDMDKAAWFLSGNGLTRGFMKRTLKAMTEFLPQPERTKLNSLVKGSDEWNEAAEPWIGQLAMLTNGQWDATLLRSVLDNALGAGGEEGLLRALAPHIGLDVKPGSVPLMVSNKGGKALRSYRTPSSPVARTMRRMAGQRPGLTPIMLEDTGEVIDKIIKYGTYAKVPTQDIARLVGRTVLAEGSLSQVEKNYETMFATFDIIEKNLVDQLAERTTVFKGEKGQARLAELKERMHATTRLTYSGMSGIRRSSALRMGHGPEKVMDEFGREMEIPPLSLDSELARGFMMLPSVDDWAAAVSLMGAVVARNNFTEGAFKWAQTIYDNLFRTSLLVFRVSYILRNSGEMQFRMFLNGHESIMADPMTMFAMTLGNGAMRGKEGRWAEFFAPYRDTALGDEFIAPAEFEDAVAARMGEYWTTTRDGLSLGDPRQFGSAATSKYEMLGFDSPNFTSGWANELITMHYSPIVRTALGDIPRDFAAPGQFATVEDAAVAWMMSDHPLAELTRARLEASDDAWKTLFSSEAMVRDYLFDNQNSVRNRAKDFTMGDEALEDFLRSGKLEVGGESWKLKGDVKERVNGLAQRLRRNYLGNQLQQDTARRHFEDNAVFVPYIDRKALEQRGIGAIDAFFYAANRVERLGTMGPEFRLTYWDEMAKLAPMLRAEDIDRALEAARTTLSPIKRLVGESKYDEVGQNHPAFAELTKAKKEGVDSLLTLDQAHDMAMKIAGDETRRLFYNAANRNSFWAATRLIFPFGQAWGNTILEWGRLASKNPIQVYKVQKAFNAAQEAGSQAAYDVFSEIGLLQDYSEGLAPWNVDPGGGFLYSDEYGSQRFMQPGFTNFGLVPQVASAVLNGTPIYGVDASASTDSLNVALGSDSPVPGVSPFMTTAMGWLPDNDITDSLTEIFNPYGSQGLSDAVPVWARSALVGLSDLPVVGPFAEFLSPLSEDIKNKNVRDATVIAASMGNYDISDPLSVQKMKEDVRHIAASLSIVEGTGKNVSPASPKIEAAMRDKDGRVIALGVLDQIYALNVENNGGDRTAAKADLIQQYGLPIIFAITGNRKGYNSIPSSQALAWARSSAENMATFRANPEETLLFFPEGDPTDLVARTLMAKLSGRDISYKNGQEQVDDVIGTLATIERAGVDSQLASGKINADQARAAKDDINERYLLTSPGTQFNSKTGTDQVKALRAVWERTPSLANTKVGVTFSVAWRLREDALDQARTLQKDPRAGLGGKNVTTLYAAYRQDIDDLVAGNPAFGPLAEVLKREFD